MYNKNLDNAIRKLIYKYEDKYFGIGPSREKITHIILENSSHSEQLRNQLQNVEYIIESIKKYLYICQYKLAVRRVYLLNNQIQIMQELLNEEI